MYTAQKEWKQDLEKLKAQVELGAEISIRILIDYCFNILKCTNQPQR